MMNKQELITRLETMLRFYNIQFNIWKDAQMTSWKNNNKVDNAYACGRMEQVMLMLKDVKRLLEEVKSLEVNKERKLVKVVKYYE